MGYSKETRDSVRLETLELKKPGPNGKKYQILWDAIGYNSKNIGFVKFNKFSID